MCTDFWEQEAELCRVGVICFSEVLVIRDIPWNLERYWPLFFVLGEAVLLTDHVQHAFVQRFGQSKGKTGPLTEIHSLHDTEEETVPS